MRAHVCARSAVDSDYLRLSQPSRATRGDAWFDLAEVLRMAGREDEAAAALGEALKCWEAKGNLASARKARAALEDLAHR